MENNSVELIDFPYPISKCTIKLQLELIMLNKETRHKVIALFYMKFQNRQNESMVTAITNLGGGGENVTGKGQEECNKNNLYFDPYLLTSQHM